MSSMTLTIHIENPEESSSLCEWYVSQFDEDGW